MRSCLHFAFELPHKMWSCAPTMATLEEGVTPGGAANKVGADFNEGLNLLRDCHRSSENALY